MRRESHALRSLQDFIRNIGIPSILKKDNARIHISKNWSEFKRQMSINGLFIELHPP